MKYLTTLRRHLAGKAERSALALIDRSLALVTLAISARKLKICLVALHIAIKFLLWVAAVDDVKTIPNEEMREEDEPP